MALDDLDDRLSMIIECDGRTHELALEIGARDRNRTDTPPFGIAADFKSAQLY
jgi:hypothetical protein